jgi:hypothetical protein
MKVQPIVSGNQPPNLLGTFGFAQENNWALQTIQKNMELANHIQKDGISKDIVVAIIKFETT